MSTARERRLKLRGLLRERGWISAKALRGGSKQFTHATDGIWAQLSWSHHLGYMVHWESPGDSGLHAHRTVAEARETYANRLRLNAIALATKVLTDA